MANHARIVVDPLLNRIRRKQIRVILKRRRGNKDGYKMPGRMPYRLVLSKMPTIDIIKKIGREMKRLFLTNRNVVDPILNR